MTIHDRIYGDVEITTPVVLELIASAPVQRLKKIAQYGIPNEFYHLQGYSRYEHSVGVMILLKKLGASEEEQIAGLLHDVSHTAFSHVIDWVISDVKNEEDYQDKQHQGIIQKSEIASILKKYNYDPVRIGHHTSFGLLDREMPDLCADRIDYCLRELDDDVAQRCLDGLTVKEGKIVCRDRALARFFADQFLNRHIEHWSGIEGATRYRRFADILRRALETNIITFEDFWQDDEYVVNKLKKSGDDMIHKVLDVLRSRSLSHLPLSKQRVYKKFRYIDPEFVDGSKLTRLSTVDNEFKNQLKEAQRKTKEGVRIASLI